MVPGRPLVLVVDDNQEILESLRSLLETALKFPVLTAQSGPEALGLLEVMPRNGVNLILSDYLMAPMHGLAFLERARDLHPEVPRVLMTAHADLDLAIHAVNGARIASLLCKPFDPVDTVRLVDNLVVKHFGAAHRETALERAARIATPPQGVGP